MMHVTTDASRRPFTSALESIYALAFSTIKRSTEQARFGGGGVLELAVERATIHGG